MSENEHAKSTNPSTLPSWQVAANKLATTKGWWDEGGPDLEGRTLGDKCMEDVAQVALDYEDYRNSGGKPVARTVGDLHMLLITEIVESYYEFMDGRELTEIYYSAENPGKPEGVPVELADLFIRLVDFCERAGINLQEVAALKHEYNRSRSYRHGNKRA